MEPCWQTTHVPRPPNACRPPLQLVGRWTSLLPGLSSAAMTAVAQCAKPHLAVLLIYPTGPAAPGAAVRQLVCSAARQLSHTSWSFSILEHVLLPERLPAVGVKAIGWLHILAQPAPPQVLQKWRQHVVWVLTSHAEQQCRVGAMHGRTMRDAWHQQTCNRDTAGARARCRTAAAPCCSGRLCTPRRGRRHARTALDSGAPAQHTTHPSLAPWHPTEVAVDISAFP